MNLTGLRYSCRVFLSTVVVSALATIAVSAQDGPGGCQAEVLDNPPRTALACPNGVSIVAEEGTVFSLVDRSDAAGPEAVRLDGRALLLEVPPGAMQSGFEVVTPQAIAAVRGTKWAVDVADGKTAVFVVNGSVAVSREPGAPAVELGAGDGVDVEPGTAPLVVRQWGAARVAALLARFGE